jgi:beta-lactamase regulating signal transducer with metallopeptidase domain
MERALIEYAVNALWQLPVLAAGTWLLVRMVRPGAAVQHRIWLGVLALALVLPLHGAFSGAAAGVSERPASALQRGSGVAETHPDSNGVTASGMSAPDQVGEAGGLVLGSLGRATGGVATRAGAWGVSKAAWGILALTRAREVRLNATAAKGIVVLYLAVVMLGLLRIAIAWRTARQLVRDSREAVLTGEERTLVAECARRMGVAAPEVREMPAREAHALTGPVVVGSTHPVLLWPEGFARELLAGNREDEVTAALCHEMAHIRRRDYLMNLVCKAAAVPLKWHPVTHGVERRIHSTREMVCDAMAAAAMESEMKYANCLLRLAESMVAGGGMAEQAGAVGLFNGNVLEERVMRLMRTEKAMSVRAKVARGVLGAATMAAAVALAGVFHVVPAMAQTVAPAPEGPSAGSVAPRTVEPPAAKPTMPPAPSHSRRTTTSIHTQILQPLPPLPGAPARAAKLAPLAPLPPLPPVAPHSGRTTTTVHTQALLLLVPPVPPSQATPAPAPAPEAAPAPAPSPEAGPDRDAPHHNEAIVSKDGKVYAWVDGKERELTPAERAKLKKQLEDAQKRIAAQAARMNSPEFRDQIENAEREAMDAQRKVNNGEIQKQIVEAQKMLSDVDVQKQMADARKQVSEAMAKLQSPEFTRQMQEAEQKALSNADIQRQMEQAQKHMAAAVAKLNSPELKVQIENAEREAMDAQRKMNNGEIQKQMAEAQKQLQQEIEKLK